MITVIFFAIFPSADEAQRRADNEKSLAAAMDALKDISDVEQAKNHEKLIEQLMEQTGEPTEEQKAEVQKYLDEVESLQARMKMEQVSQKEKLRQKLGARRKLREEVMVEEAVAEELDHITKKEVCDGERRRGCYS